MGQQTPTKRNGTVRRAKARRHSRRLAPMDYLFVLTAFASAALFFALEPMFAKMALPVMGGAPAVWNTCLVFYQASLLLGYIYAHWSLKWLGPRRQPAVHLVLMCLPWLAIPIGVAQNWTPASDAFPVLGLWMLLSISVGLPFFVVSASAPMLQAWLGRTTSRSARDPYFLYAASNLGSLLAVFSYPLVESYVGLAQQAFAWACGYGLLMAMMAGCAIQLWRSPAAVPPMEQILAAKGKKGEPLAVSRRLYWVALSLVPSSLLFGVTTYISTNIAQIGLLWMAPLSLYLLTLVLVFARRSTVPAAWPMEAQPFFVVAAVALLAWQPQGLIPILTVGLLQLVAFFIAAMVCHGQLAADRPSRRHLTEFYLWISVGGVLGGLFNVVAAPLVFPNSMEYPLMLAAACLLRPWPAPCGAWATARQIAVPTVILAVCCGLVGTMLSPSAALEWQFMDVPLAKLALVTLAAAATFALRQRPIRLTVGVMVLLALCISYPQGKMRLLHAERSFFGELQVLEEPSWNAHVFEHGSAIQGTQSLDRKLQREPWAYYSRSGPLGQIFHLLQGRRPLGEIGVLGLGVGTVAAYGQPGERITFYEIDPAVEQIARNPDCFTYLNDCRAKVEVVLGDARLSLENGPPRQFDLLVLDVFNSDAMPIHLLTREAMKVYRDRLAEHGLLAIHVSGHCLDLAPVLGRLAADRDIGMVAMVSSDEGVEGALDRFGSTWVVMAKQAGDLASLAGNAAWKPLKSDGAVAWTDDYSNVVGSLAWAYPWDSLRFSSLWRPDRSEASFHASVGTALYDQNRLGQALAHFEKALELSPDNAKYHNRIGLILQRQGKLDEAIDHFRQSLELMPDDAEVYSNLGLALLSQRKVEEAIVFLRRATELNPNDAKAHHDLAGVFASYGQVAEAVPQFEKALEISPDYAEAHNNLGCILATAGQTEAAIAHFRRALELKPDYAEVESNLAGLLAADGQIDDAIARYRKAIKLRPDHAEAHYKLGGLLEDRGDTEEAISQYRSALAIEPGFAEAHRNLGNALRSQGKIDEAIVHYRKTLELAPQDAKSHFYMGVALERLGRFVDAAAQYEKALTVSPNYQSAMNNLAWLRATCSDAAVRNGAKAVELANKALDLAGGNDPSILDTLAAAYAEAGQFTAAVDTAKMAIDLATEQEDESLAESIQKKLPLYKANTPFHDTSGAESEPVKKQSEPVKKP